jgi:trans-2,3-dihydro-3-hydroxyanthranilate isomerase
MTRAFKFRQVDTFTDQPLQGNPCAIIYDADVLTDADMLAIAREMNLSETAFIMKSACADFRFRYFTMAGEIPLAGHPTIASVYSLIEDGIIPLSTAKIVVELTAGLIEVFIRHENGKPLIAMLQLPPQFLHIYAASEVTPCFGLTADDLYLDVPIQTVSTGTPMLMIAVKDTAVLSKIRFRPDLFEALSKSGDFFSAHLFCLGGFTSSGDTAARHFVEPPSVMEDSFTGSATGAMACYLWKHHLITSPSFIAEQGHLMHRPGKALVELTAKGDSIIGVSIGGNAVTSLRGELIF